MNKSKLYRPTSDISIEFAKSIQDEIDWKWLSKHPWLDREFLYNFKDRVDWYDVSLYNKELIASHDYYFKRYKSHIQWHYFKHNRHFSDEYKHRFKDEILFYELKYGEVDPITKTIKMNTKETKKEKEKEYDLPKYEEVEKPFKFKKWLYFKWSN